MIVSIASGKGGTGKTSVAVNMALALKNLLLLDCDVEEPNTHLLLNTEETQTSPVFIDVPIINEEKCDLCKKCAEFCQFNAILIGLKKPLVFPDLCHDCGGCALVCPKDAIKYEKIKVGTLKNSHTNGFTLIQGVLDIAQSKGIPVIKAVKQHITQEKDVIIDSPPGASCPFIETIHGSDFCLLVTDPTPFGVHDLDLVVQVLQQTSIPFGVVVNRATEDMTQIHQYCNSKNISILLEIPFQRRIAELYSRGIPFSQEMPEWIPKFKHLFEQIRELTLK